MARTISCHPGLSLSPLFWLVFYLSVLSPATSSVLASEEASSRKSGEDGFVALFDGKSFRGWSGNMKHFRIEDGAIVAGTMKEKIPNNEFLTTDRQFGDFELRLKAKLEGKGGNAGIQIRSRRPTKQEIESTEKKKRLPSYEMVGYQVDMGKAWDKIWWGKLYDESRRRTVLAGPADDKTLEKIVKWDSWNDYRIVAKGKRIKIWLNGTQTVNYTEPDAEIAAKGVIGLQIHGGPPSQASYKEIRIKVLSDK